MRDWHNTHTYTTIPEIEPGTGRKLSKVEREMMADRMLPAKERERLMKGLKSVLTDEQIGIIGSALFLTYGIGQLVSGVLGDRFDPRKLILFGLYTTAACNAAFPFITSMPVLTVLWAINGFAQAMFWPPLVKIMSLYITKRDRYAKACVRVSFAAQFSLLSVFGTAALFIHFNAWQGSFAVATALALSCAAVLHVGFRTLERRYPGAVEAAMASKQAAPSQQEKKDATPIGIWAVILSTGLLFVFVMMAINGILRDGLEEWLSTYLQDTFSLRADFSTVMNVAMPLFSLLCIRITAYLFTQVFRDAVRQAAVVTLVAAIGLIVLGLVFSVNFILSLVLLMLIIGCIHSANTCLTSYLPIKYTYTGRVSTFAGVINAFTYVGSTLATTAVPVLVGRTSWPTTFFTLSVAALVCVACGAVVVAINRKHPTPQAPE